MLPALDVEFARSQFPALDDEWALMDNAGGSVAARQVIERVHDVMSKYQVQLGATYPLSQTAAKLVHDGRCAMAELIHAEPDEVVVGPSTTMNVKTLAAALRPTLAAGDEVIVTNLDHEANVGAWRQLEEHGIVVREWCVDPSSVALEVDALDALLRDRTRLVCLTHCSNITGEINDVAAIARRVHESGALVCVDGVAYAPHRRVDVKALDVDFYLLSLYKCYGPHLALMYGKHEHLRRARGQYHFFHPEDHVPHKFTPGNPNHELTSALPGILDYLGALARHHGVEAPANAAGELGVLFDMIAEHEEQLAAPILEFLRSHPKVTVIGPTESARRIRVPTISFAIEGRDSSEIPPLLERERLAVRYGHFYAYRLIRDLGLLERDGVVRVSLVHYNRIAEVERLIAALDRIL
jgi:cysteine desulfurase family protein (TIGR01976 family)